MSPNRLSNLTIVVVEDHDDSRNFLAIYLRRFAANVVEARNAVEGLHAIKNAQPNLVLCDIQMPDVDGFELLRQIRALGPGAGGDVPIIAMSAIFSRADRPHIFAAGFQECVAKPFGADQLMEAILRVLGD